MTGAVVAAEYLAPNATEARDLVVPVDLIQTSALNPRKQFDEAKLVELAESIRQHGLLEPIVVREAAGETLAHPQPGFTTVLVTYEIVAGERRYRACRLAGLDRVPVRNLGIIDDRVALELALIENLQRVDLDVIEEAEGYRQLNRVVGKTQAEIAEAVKRSQPAVANALRLLELPEAVQERIRARDLSASHGIALARFKSFPKVVSALAALAVAQDWTAKRCLDPELWSLAQAGLVKELSHPAIFDLKQCDQCPFGAKFKRYCLKPSHWDELQGAAKRERQAEISRAVLAVKREGGTLLDLSRVHYDSYERLPLSGKCVYDRADAPCPCRVQAKDRHEVALVWVCTDVVRRRQLSAERTREETKEKRAAGKGLLARVVAALDGQQTLSPEALALLAAAALSTINHPTQMHLAAERHAPDAVPERAGKGWFDALFLDVLTDLADRDPAALGRLVVEALLREEVHNQTEGYGGSPKWTEWYLQRVVGEAAAAVGDDGGA